MRTVFISEDRHRLSQVRQRLAALPGHALSKTAPLPPEEAATEAPSTWIAESAARMAAWSQAQQA